MAAVVCAGIFGYQWYDAKFNVVSTQQERDDALDGAEQVILNVTNIDPNNLTAFREQVDSSLTGDAKSQITAQDFEQLSQGVAGANGQAATATSVIKRSGVVEFNNDESTAKVLVYADVTSTAADAKKTGVSMGFLLDVKKVDGTWKASNIVPLETLMLNDPAADNSTTGTGGN